MTMRKVYETPIQYRGVFHIQQCKVYHDTEWHEYCVRLFVNGNHMVSANYHTDDKNDAFDSAMKLATALYVVVE